MKKTILAIMFAVISIMSFNVMAECASCHQATVDEPVAMYNQFEVSADVTETVMAENENINYTNKTTILVATIPDPIIHVIAYLPESSGKTMFSTGFGGSSPSTLSV